MATAKTTSIQSNLTRRITVLKKQSLAINGMVSYVANHKHCLQYYACRKWPYVANC